jgi:hypothetical protein
MSTHPDIEELEQVAKGGGAAAVREHVEGCAECAREVAWARTERELFARRALPDVTNLWAGVERQLAEQMDGQLAERDAGKPLAAAAQKSILRRPHWHRRAAALLGAVAAAAVVLFAVRPKQAPVAPSQPVAQGQAPGQPGQTAGAQPDQQLTEARRARLDPKALAALDTAEADYRHAASVLEAEYESLRPHLDPALAKRWDETLTRARTQLVQSRAAVASDDVRARMRVLDGYAEYLRSLRDVIQDSEEATP